MLRKWWISSARKHGHNKSVSLLIMHTITSQSQQLRLHGHFFSLSLAFFMCSSFLPIFFWISSKKNLFFLHLSQFSSVFMSSVCSRMPFSPNWHNIYKIWFLMRLTWRFYGSITFRLDLLCASGFFSVIAAIVFLIDAILLVRAGNRGEFEY